MNRIDLYAENIIKGFYPLFKTDNAVYLYHYVYDDDEYDDEDNKYGFCVLYSDMYYLDFFQILYIQNLLLNLHFLIQILKLVLFCLNHI